MFTSKKEYKKYSNNLNLNQKIIHIDNTMNELKELYCSASPNITLTDIDYILKNLKEFFTYKNQCINQNIH